MKKTAKIVLLLLFAVMLVSTTGLAKKTTITWWINPWRIAPPGMEADKAGENFPKWISEEFMKANPDINVEYVVVGNKEFSQKMAAAIATGTQPDVFKGPVWDSRWAKAGLLEPIDEYLTEEDWNDYYDVAMATGEVEGKHYVWPWNLGTNGMGTTMLLYTPDFEKAGIDWQKIVKEGWTMEEFLDACEKLTWDSDNDGENDHFAVSFAAGDHHNILNFIYAHGADLVNADETEIVMNSDEGVAGLQFLVDLVHKYGYAPKGVEGMGIYDVIGNFHSHRASMGFGGPYELNRITRYVNSGKLAEKFYPVIAPFPHVEGSSPVAYGGAGGFITFKQKDAAKKEAVMKFVKFLTNNENTAMLKSLFYLTARKSVNDGLYADDAYINDQVKVFSTAMEEGGRDFFGSQEFPWSQIKDYFSAALEASFGQTKTVEKALDDFASEANSILSRYKK